MAARKSCTHMTWAEAKAKSGVGGTGKKDKKQQPIRQDHGKLLAAKIVAKNAPPPTDRIKDRQAAKQARKEQERQEQLDAIREAEKEKKRLEDVVQPHQLAIKHMQELAKEIQQQENAVDANSVHVEDKWSEICESKQLQVDEIIALEAIYADTRVLTVSNASQLEDLQQKMEEWQMEPDDKSKQQAVVEYPSLSFTLIRSFEDPQNDDMVAHLLLKIRFPSGYPLHVTPPTVEIGWFLLTQKSMTVSSNKPLESTNLGTLNKKELLQAIQEQSQELLGMPCVYEVLDTFLSENIFDYITRTNTFAT